MSAEPMEIEEHAGCIWNGRKVVVVHHGGLLRAHTEIRMDGTTVARTPRRAFGSKRASGSVALEGGETRSLECDDLWWGPVAVRIGGETVYRGVPPSAVKQLAASTLVGIIVGLPLGYVAGDLLAGLI